MKRINNLISTTRNSEFARLNVVFFVGSMIIAFLNYLYYPVMGRLLPTASFGELQVIVSTFMQLTILLSVMSLVVVNILVNQKDSAVAEKTVAELERLSLYIGAGLLIVLLVAADPISKALKFESVWPFIAMGIAFVLGIPLTFRTAYLRSAKDFGGVSIAGVVASSVKIMASAILVMMSMQVFGAVIGIAVSQAVSMAYIGYRLRKNGYVRHKLSGRVPDWSLLRPQAKYALFVLYISLLTTIQISFDVVVVKYLFSPEVAGSYAAISTIARIIFFLTGSIVAIMLSSVGPTKPQRDNTQLLLKSLGLTVAAGGLATLVFCAWPLLVIHLLLGSRYDAFASVLPMLSVAVFVGSLVNLLVNYHIAMRHYISGIFVALGSLTSLIYILAFHAMVTDIVLGLLAGVIVMFVGLCVYSACKIRQHSVQ